MTRMLSTAGAVLFLAGCSAKLDVPAGAQVTCGSDADCPEGWTCRTSLGRCLRSGGDDVPPAVVPGSVQLAHETCGPLQPVEITFTVSEELAQPPSVLVGAPTRPELALESQAGLTYTFSYTPASEAAAPSGNWPVIADLVDRTGNRAQGVSLASVTLDHTPPEVVAPSEQYFADAGNLLARVGAVRNGGRYALYFGTTEPLSAAPVVVAQCASGPLALSRKAGETAPTFFTYELALDQTVATDDGACPIEVSLVDAAANPGGAVAVAGVALVVDRTPPDADVAVELASLKQLRVPWGAAQTGGEPGQFLTLASLSAATDPSTVPLPADTFAAAGESIVQVRLHSQGIGGLLLGTLLPEGGSGAWQVSNLGSDSARMWVSIVDSAGNESERRPVPLVEWVATLGGKVRESTFENPTTLLQSESIRPVYAQDLSRTVEPDAAGLAAVRDPGGGAAVQVGQGRWRRLEISATELRVGANWPAAFDGIDGTTLVYDGNAKQLWQHDGADNQWRPLSTSGQRPGSEQGAVLGVDTQNARVLLFGGRAGGGWDPETWEWDLLTGRWLKRTPPAGQPAPDIRDQSAVVFDSRRGRSMLFGGYYYGDHDDLWDWDSATGTWVEWPKQGPWPAPRRLQAMAYDETRGVLVMFGGVAYEGGQPCPTGSITDGTGSCVFGDTWEFAPATGTWTLTVPNGSGPARRYWGGGAYDRLRQRTVVFGGYSWNGTFFTYGNDLWEYTGGAWAPRNLAGPPGARWMQAVAYDWVRSRLLVFGGYAGGGSTDNWMLDSAAGRWKALTRSAVAPEFREPTGMFTDGVRGGVLLFGGYQSGGAYNDVWRLDLETMNWTLLEPDGTTAAFPPKGYCSACNGDATYDPTRDRLILYLTSGAIWEYDVAGSTWVTRTQSGALPWTRDTAAIAFDASRNVLVMYGGARYNVTSCADGSAVVPSGCTSSCTCLYRDLREWNPATGAWTLRVATGSPSPRDGHRLVYDPNRHQVIVVGGYVNGQGYASDTWAWNGAGGGTFTLLEDEANGPGARFRHSVTFDESRDMATTFSGFPAHQLAEWDAGSATWTMRIPLGDQPEEDQFQGIAYDRTTRQLTTFFGNGYSTGGHWTYDPGAAARPAFLYDVPLSFSALESPARIDLRLAAGARGYSARTPVDGWELQGWTPAGFVVLGSADDPPQGATARTVTVGDPDLLRRLAFGQANRVLVAVMPKGPNGQSASMAEVTLDWIELRATFAP